MPNYTIPYYTSDYYTLTSWPVVLDGLTQSQVLSVSEVERTAGLLLGDLAQAQALSESSPERILSVVLDLLRQDQAFATMLAERIAVASLGSLTQTQELEQAEVRLAGRCFCISLSAEKKIVVTFGAGRKPIVVEFQTLTCGA